MLKVTMKKGEIYFTLEITTSGVLYPMINFENCKDGKYLSFEICDVLSIKQATPKEKKKILDK